MIARFYKAFLVLFAALAGCASPRYTYYFPQSAPPPVVSKPVAVPVIPREESVVLTAGTQVEAGLQTGSGLARPNLQQKVMITEVTEPVINTKPLPKKVGTPAAPSKADKDGKLGIVFFVAGAVVYLIGGPVFNVVGALAMMIGVIFGIKWLLRK